MVGTTGQGGAPARGRANVGSRRGRKVGESRTRDRDALRTGSRMLTEETPMIPSLPEVRSSKGVRDRAEAWAPRRTSSHDGWRASVRVTACLVGTSVSAMIPRGNCSVQLPSRLAAVIRSEMQAKGSRRSAASDTLSSQEGSQVAPVRATPTACLQELFEEWSRSSVSSTFQAVSRDVARARQSQNVPVSYPRSVHFSPSQATPYAHLQGFCASPLTDSNRRPPLYEGGLVGQVVALCRLLVKVGERGGVVERRSSLYRLLEGGQGRWEFATSPERGCQARW
jgi:hypothetical protein